MVLSLITLYRKKNQVSDKEMILGFLGSHTQRKQSQVCLTPSCVIQTPLGRARLRPTHRKPEGRVVFIYKLLTSSVIYISST